MISTAIGSGGANWTVIDGDISNCRRAVVCATRVAPLFTSVQRRLGRGHTLQLGTMNTSKGRPGPALSADGNSEERSAQIEHIQERLSRLESDHHQIGAEESKDDVRMLDHDSRPRPPSSKQTD